MRPYQSRLRWRSNFLRMNRFPCQFLRSGLRPEGAEGLSPAFCTCIALLTRTRLVHGRGLGRTDCASERRSDNRPALQRRCSKTKREPPSRRAGVKRHKLLLSTKNREAWTLFSAKLGYSDPLQAQGLTPALRDGADLESSVTGAEAPAYYQGVPPDFAKASSGTPGRILARLDALNRYAVLTPGRASLKSESP
jgi:hypothetical protein